METKVHNVDTGKAQLLLVQIPADLKFYLNDFGVTGISQSEGLGAAKYISNIIIEDIGQYKAVGKLGDLSNEQVQKLVEKEANLTWKNYSGDHILITAWQSLYSCFQASGLITEKPNLPKPKFDNDIVELRDIYKKDMNKYIDPRTTLVLKKKK